MTLTSEMIAHAVRRTGRSAADVVAARARLNPPGRAQVLAEYDQPRYLDPAADRAQIDAVPLWRAVPIALRALFCRHRHARVTNSYAIGSTMGISGYADRVWRFCNACPACGLTYQTHGVLWGGADFKVYTHAYDEGLFPIDTATGLRLPAAHVVKNRSNLRPLGVLGATIIATLAALRSSKPAKA